MDVPEAGEADNGFEQERMKRFIHLMKALVPAFSE